MKILQLLHGENYSGMEKSCIDLTNQLSLNHKVYFMGSIKFKDKLYKQVVFLEMNVKKSRNNILHLFSTYKQIEKINPDIIHLHKQKSIQTINRIKNFLNIPIIVTKHDTQKKKAFLGVENAVTITNEVEKTIKAKNIFKIYNGIPYLKPNKIDLSDDFKIIAVGGLRKVKAFDSLIEACSRLPFSYHLYILGEGSEREKLETLIHNLNLQKKVTLLGFKSNVNDYLYSSDLQIISSNTEGFSLAMIEGIFYSKILISTPVSGCTEILNNNLLVEKENLTQKIIEVHEKRNFYISEFEKIKFMKDNLTIESCANKYIEVFKEIINKKENK